MRSSECEIVLQCLSHQLHYEYEMIEEVDQYVHTQASLRTTLHVVAAVAQCAGALLHGGDLRGKTHTLRMIAQMLGRPIYTLALPYQDEIDEQHNENTHIAITNAVAGAVKGGFWLLVEDVNTAARSALSCVAQLVQ